MAYHYWFNPIHFSVTVLEWPVNWTQTSFRLFLQGHEYAHWSVINFILSVYFFLNKEDNLTNFKLPGKTHLDLEPFINFAIPQTVYGIDFGSNFQNSIADLCFFALKIIYDFHNIGVIYASKLKHVVMHIIFIHLDVKSIKNLTFLSPPEEQLWNASLSAVNGLKVLQRVCFCITVTS